MCVQRGAEIGGGDPRVGETTSIELLGQFAHRVVAPGPHRGQDLADRCQCGDVVAGGRARERAGQIGAAAEVESGEHGAVIVSLGCPEPSALSPP